MDVGLIIKALDRRVERREGRRDFFKTMGGVAAGAAGTMVLTACGGGSGTSTTPAMGQTSGPSDADILNFALNLEYLEAQFYSYAATGGPLPNSMLTGTGTQGAVNAAGAGMVPFSDPVVAAYAKEIAKDEGEHVNFLRGALGSAAVAQPALDISTGATGSFSTLAQAAGFVPAGGTFSPYISDINFLLGAFIFEDVGVTAYKGAAPLISNKTYLEAAAGILAAEAYHASLVRTVLFAKGVSTTMTTAPVGVQPTDILSDVQKISDARDSVDGPTDDDQGIGTISASNIVPLDSNGIAFSRTTGQVLNVVYLTKLAATKGGFFPNGMNGTINTSTAES